MSLPITNPSNNAQTASTVEAAVSDAIAIITNTRVPKPPWETVQQHPHIRPSERHIEELESYAFPGCTPETKPWGLTINLSSLYIGSDQVARIGRTLALNQTVTTLDLSMCDMYSSGCEALMTCLKRNYILKHLSLCGNKIGPRGAVAIAEYLSMDNTGILESAIAKTEASFLKCNSTTSGVNTRSQGGENSSSEYLTTAAASPPITISPVGFHNLQPPSPVYIPPNKALNSIPYDRKWEYDKYGQNIPLGGRDVTDSASKRVIQSLTNSSGKADTEVSSEGGKGDKVLHGAEKSTVVGLYPDIRKDAMTKDTRPPPPCYLRCPLQSLGLSFNAIGDEGVICIMNSLRTNRELKSLNLRGNNITNLGAFAVLDALQDHYTLEEDLLSHAAKLKMIASMGKKGKSKNKGDGAKGKGPTPQKIENDDRPEKEGENKEFKLARVNKEAPKPPKSCLPDRLRFDIDTLREQKHMQKKHNEALVKCGLADMSSDIAIPEVKERDSSVERNDECSADIGSNQRRENISQNNVSSRRIVPPSAPELFQVLFRFLSGVYIPSLTSPAFIVPFSGDDNPAVLSVKEKKKALSDVLIAAGVTTNKMAESLLDMVSHGESYNAAQTLKTVLPQHDDNDETSAADTPRTKCINLSDVSTTTAAAAATCGNRFDAPTGNKERSKAFSARWKGMKVEQRLEFIQFNFPQFSSAAAIFLLGQRGNESRCEITNPYTPNPLLYNAMKILSAGNLTLKLSLLTPYHHDDSNISKYNNMIAVNCSRVAYDLLYHPVSHESKSKYPSSDVYVSKGDSQRRRSTSADDTLSKSVKDQEKRSSTEQLTTGDVNTLVLEQSIATTQQKMRTYTQEYEEATEVKKDTDKLLITSLMECKEYPSLLENTGGFFYPTLAVSPTAEGIKVPSYHVLHTPRAPDVSHDGNATPSVILSTRSTDGQILACDIANSNSSNIQSLSLFPQTRIALASIISASGVQFIQKTNDRCYAI